MVHFQTASSFALLGLSRSAKPSFPGEVLPRKASQGWGIEFQAVTTTGLLREHDVNMFNMCQGLNSHYFHIIGDGHQPNSRGLYTHYKDSY